MRKLVLLFLTTAGIPLLLLAQTRQITGTVSDENGNLLPFVSVLEKGTNNGTVTNELGAFSITVSAPNAILIFSYSGRQSQELRLGSENTYNISLRPDGNLSEVVVTAFGIRKERKALGYSAQEVKAEELTA